MFKMKKLAAIVIAAVMTTGIGSFTANAEPLPVEEPMEIVITAEDIVSPCSTTVTKCYDCSDVQNIGVFKTSSSSVSLSFGAPAVGAVAIKFHTGSYTGPVYKTIIPPEAGSTSTTLYTSFNVNYGTTFYITAEPASGYLATRGCFTITY